MNTQQKTMKFITFIVLCHLANIAIQNVHGLRAMNVITPISTTTTTTNGYNIHSSLQQIRGGSDHTNNSNNKRRNKKTDLKARRNSKIYDAARRGGALATPASSSLLSSNTFIPRTYAEVMNRFYQMEERSKKLNHYGWGNYFMNNNKEQRKDTKLNVLSQPTAMEKESKGSKNANGESGGGGGGNGRNTNIDFDILSFSRAKASLNADQDDNDVVNDIMGSKRSETNPSSNNLEKTNSKITNSPPESSSSSTLTSRQKSKQKNKKNNISHLDVSVLTAYICNMFCATAPVVLIPVIAGDPSMLLPTSSMFSTVTAASFAASVASISSLGGGFGKLINGFVCQTLGSRRSLTVYLSALSGFMLWFSRAQNIEQLAFANTGMEFTSSIMWTACAVVFATHYENDSNRFTKSIGLLSLSSTAASLVSKLLLSSLLSFMDWRSLASFSALIAAFGALVVNRFVSDSVEQKVKPEVESLSLSSIGDSVQKVTSNKFFWRVGLAHAAVFLVRTSDKVMGSFFQEVTNLPRSACGGLTAFITVGFAAGALLGAQTFNSLPTSKEKKDFVMGLNYISVLSALVLAICASPSTQSLIASIIGAPILLPSILALASGILACAVSFQFYTFPAKFAANFGNNKAVCLSFIDGLGFFTCSLVWNLSSRIVGENGILSQWDGLGWIVTWSFLASCLFAGGNAMQPMLPRIFQWKKELRLEKKQNYKLSKSRK